MKKTKIKENSKKSAKMDLDKEVTNDLIQEQLKAYKSNDAVHDFMAGVVAGMLWGYKMPLDGFVGKVKEMLEAFDKSSEECNNMMDAIRDNKAQVADGD